MPPRYVLNETDAYREFAPPARLRGAVACLWVRRGQGQVVRVLPDACADIVWRPGRDAFVAGPDTGAWETRAWDGQLIVGARLRPGAGGAVLGLPLSELRDQRLPLAEIGLDRRLRFADGSDPERALETILAGVAALVCERPPDVAVQAAALRLNDPRQRIEALADDLGFSERQLRRRLHDAVGYGPKMLQRVLRLRRFMAQTVDARAAGDLAAAAFAAGYADQAHLTRECRALTGLSPRQLVGIRA